MSDAAVAMNLQNLAQILQGILNELRMIRQAQERIAAQNPR